jgi:hypothetical protein
MAKVYISGKVTGLDYNVAYKMFEDAEQEVKKLGGTPINPMKFCPNEPSWTWEQYMEICCKELLYCDGIYMLNNWGHSKGARCEYALAKELGLTVQFQK